MRDAALEARLFQPLLFTMACIGFVGCTSEQTPRDEAMDVADATTTDALESSTDSWEAGSSDGSSTTGTRHECSDDASCPDWWAPLCVDGECMSCGDAADPNAACERADASAPRCINRHCLQCTFWDVSACDESAPVCDRTTLSCTPCSFHEQCQQVGAPGCNIATGRCFGGEEIIEIDLDVDPPDAMRRAVEQAPEGSQRVVLLDGRGPVEPVQIGGGRTVAILPASETIPFAEGQGGPTFRVSGLGSTLILGKIHVVHNPVAEGVEVALLGSLHADSTRIAENGGGGITMARTSAASLRNTTVSSSSGAIAIDAASAQLEIVYGSILAGAGDARGLFCSDGTDVHVRNSVVASQGGAAIQCPNATVTDSLQSTDRSVVGWFEDFGRGDARLTGAGARALAGVAVWRDGDPPFDHGSEARPSVDGASDFAGVDVVKNE